MPRLAELQDRFAQAVMTGDVPAAQFAGRVPPADALSVHRDTVMAGLVNALRITCPTVDALVGEQFFDHAGCVFAGMNPPTVASLSAYGESFADFLAGFAPTLAYLPDVARLDRAVEIALRSPLLPRRFALDAAVAIELPQSLVALRLEYPADEIRAALGDDAAMAVIAIIPAERFILVWRKGFEAAAQRVDAAAGRFLVSLLAGEGAEAAFRAAAGHASGLDAMKAIQTGVFAAPFCTVISAAEEFSP